MKNLQQNLWLVGQVSRDNHREWQFQGIFSDEETAVSACVDGAFFVAPVIVDKLLPIEPVDWSGAYYPKQL